MKISPEQNKSEQLSEEEFLRAKSGAQIHLMIDAGIQPDDDVGAREWVEANSERFNKIFDRQMAFKYQLNPTDTALEIKKMLYH